MDCINPLATSQGVDKEKIYERISHKRARGGIFNPRIKYLFNDGDKCEKVTSGWVASGYGNYYYREKGHGVLSFGGSLMSVNNGNCWSDYDSFGLRTTIPVKIDDYNTLNILDNNGTKYSVDISDIIGTYYVAIGMSYHENGYREGRFGIWSVSSGTYAQSLANVNIGYRNPTEVQRIWLEK